MKRRPMVDPTLSRVDGAQSLVVCGGRPLAPRIGLVAQMPLTALFFAPCV